MQIIELVLQGVGRFAASQKIAFKPGLNVIFGPNGSGKSTVARCVHSLLYPASAPDGANLIAWESPQLSRAALTFKGSDGAVYRTIRDFVTGGCTLARANPETKKYESVETGEAAVEARLRELGAPSPQLFASLFLLHEEALPTGGGGFGASSAFDVEGGLASGPSGGGDEGSFFQGNVHVEAHEMTADDKRARIELLKNEIDNASKLEEMQFELDGVESKKFEYEDKLRAIHQMEGRIREGREKLAQFSDVLNIDAELEQRLVRFEKTQESHAQDMAQREQQKIDMGRDLEFDQNSLEPFFKNPIVLGGVGLTVLSIILGIVGSAADINILRKLILLLPVGMGVAGFGYYLWFERSKKVKAAEEKFQELVTSIDEAHRRFDVDSAMVKGLLQKMGVDDVKEILERIRGAKKYKQGVAELESQLEAQRNQPEVKQAIEEMSGLEKRIEELQDQIAQFGGMGMDSTQIKIEIDRLEAELAGGGVTNPGLSSPGLSSPGLGAPAAAGEGSGGGVGALLSAAAEVRGQDPGDFSLEEHDRLLSRIGAFTGSRHPSGELYDGELKLAAGNGQLVEWEKLSNSTKEAAYLAVALGTAETLQSKFPLVWDDIAARFDEERIGSIAGAVKSLVAASLGQAIWMTSRKELAALADHMVRLPK
ncbi:MAG: AAA family ATPase [Chrysiogenetes bacterium]|nr:AAA family ATPase [Chrysiogenetes bacterium]